MAHFSTHHRYALKLFAELENVKKELLFYQHFCNVISQEGAPAQLRDLGQQEGIIERVRSIFKQFSSAEEPEVAAKGACEAVKVLYAYEPNEPNRLEVVAHLVAVGVFSHIAEVQQAGGNPLS